MAERSQHRVSDSPEGESERPATGHGQPRTVGGDLQPRAEAVHHLVEATGETGVGGVQVFGL